MKRLLMGALAVLSVAATTGALVPAARGTNTLVVPVISCDLSGGTWSVPSGVPIAIRGIGYAQGTYGLMLDFLRKQQTTLTTVYTGTSTVYELSSQWGVPQHLDDVWLTRLPDTDLAITLAPGESISATYDITFTQPLLVAYPPVGPTGDNGPFLVNEDGPFSCLITAE
jgi:hypothetical protein